MTSKRVNVLIYAGNGATSESVRHCLYTFRRLLSPNYAVIPITGDTIIKEPWSASCALLVFPGGADLGYCRTLNGEGNRKISQYVNRGGNYVGFCAGGYYGTRRCEFEVGDKKMEVIGERELGFFPGTCRGLAFSGFVYNSEAGARAVELEINATCLPDVDDQTTFKSYYNGGGVFVDAANMRDRGVEILASFTEELHVDSGAGKAAVVYRKVGDGAIILTGPHPEFAGVNLSKTGADDRYKKVVEDVTADDKPRTAFLKACLKKLGLDVNKDEQPVPSLSRLHLSSHRAADVTELVSTWAEISTIVDGEEYIKGENDTFLLERPSTWSLSTVKDVVDTIASVIPGIQPSKQEDVLGIDAVGYNQVVKKIFAHTNEPPTHKETPHFNHAAYYSNLSEARKSATEKDGEFGKYLLYGEVVTSTNTILEKNVAWLKHLPSGLTFTANTQVAGRGRGTNVWVSPPGALIFSTVLRHSLSLSSTAPVVFAQYLVALAIVAGVKSYEPGYHCLPVKLKWPNDIYALDPEAPDDAEGGGYVKIGGILVNSSYSGSDYTLVVGVGMNVANAAPTTSLDKLAKVKGLRPFQMEKLLAKILVCFEDLYRQFCRTGWDKELEQRYYNCWLHSDQIVTLESAGGVRARITGITRDWGLLLAEELGWEDRGTGTMISLQSDSNSFDFFKGLVKRKV